MERIRNNTNFPQACFLCPARTYKDEEYYCDRRKLDDPNLYLKVAHYQPTECPNKLKTTKDSSVSVEILLRKTLHK